MADYYPLLAKAVATQTDPNARRAVYERARKALVAQLRAIQPPIAEADIERENEALDLAITRVEAELSAAKQPAEAATPQGGVPSATAPAAAAGPTRTRVPARPPPTLRPRVPVGGEAARPDSSSPAEAASEALAGAVGSPAAGEPPGAPQARDGVIRPVVPLTGLPGALGQAEADVRGREQLHPAAPRPPSAARRNPGLWIAGAVLALVIVAVAAAAWKLRDRPEDLARGKPVATQPSDAGNAKLADRVGGANTPAAGTASSSAAPSKEGPAIAVAHRAALLVEAPQEETKVKTYIGSVVWRLENVSRDSGQALSNAVRADVDIPEAKLKVALTFQKNLDPALPASHTISIRFTPLAGNDIGDVQQIDSPQMRRDESPNGEPLGAIPVPIMDNNFLVGLARGDFEARNLDLIKTRAWIDIPILLKSKRVAKLTLEKGATGERAINDAIAAWAQ